MSRLEPQPWMTAKSAQRVMAALDAIRPGCARFVGGCVRNALLGEPVADIDIATQLVPELVQKVMIAAKIAVHPTGIEHGTLTVVADHHPFEVTSLRQDVETDGRRAVVAFTDDWLEDAGRRDFTFNALYADRDGTLYDPFDGRRDLAEARVRPDLGADGWKVHQRDVAQLVDGGLVLGADHLNLPAPWSGL